MIRILKISDSLGHYTTCIKSGNDLYSPCHLSLRISAQSCDCAHKELGCVTVLRHISPYNHPECCCEILSHM